MIVSCNQCNVRLKIDESKIKEGGSRLKCPKCGNIFLVEKPAAAPTPPPPPPEPSWPPIEEPPAPKPSEPSFTPPPPPPPKPVAPPVEAPPKPKAAPGPKWKLDRSKIVVAHDGDSVLKLVESILSAEGYQVITESDGVSAVVSIEKEKPFLVIIDVALPRIYGFEICDRLKNSPESSDVKVILIASIYDKTRYKREPVSLYGADDYIEKHHIQDCIAQKVKRLAAEPLAPGMKAPREEEYCKPSGQDLAMRQEQGIEMRQEEISQVSAPAVSSAPAFSAQSPIFSQQEVDRQQEAAPQPTVDRQLVEAARRFARIILSDIALYNQGAVEDGVRNGNFEEALAAELKEGRELYNGRVSKEVIASGDYFAEEITLFVQKKRQTMGLGF